MDQTQTNRAPYGAPGSLPRADGRHRCINSEPGTYNHECGKPATWIGTDRTGFQACYCDACKLSGYEARKVIEWHQIGGQS